MVAVRHVNKEERIMQYQDVTDDDVDALNKYFEQGGNGKAACKFSFILLLSLS